MLISSWLHLHICQDATVILTFSSKCCINHQKLKSVQSVSAISISPDFTGGHRLSSCCMTDAFRGDSSVLFCKKLSSSELVSLPPPALCTVCPAKIFAALFYKPILSYFHCLPMTPESHSSTSWSNSSPTSLTTLLAHFQRPSLLFKDKTFC